MDEDYLRELGAILRAEPVARLIRAAPESWLWTLLNAIVSSLPRQRLASVPGVIVAIVGVLFSVFNPGYIDRFVRKPDFYATPADELRHQYDYIIVGGGSAGCLLANRLSAAGSVLLIEAGSVTNVLSHVPLLNTANLQHEEFGLDWRYWSVLQRHSFRRSHNKRAHMGAGRGLGGSSHINFQVYSRAWDEDYDRWERVYGAEGWNSKEMIKYMKVHEKFFSDSPHYSGRHGTQGELSVNKAYIGNKRQPLVDALMQHAASATSSKVVEDHNGGQGPGFSVPQTTVDTSGRISHSAAAFIDPIRRQRKENLHIILDAMVDKVVLDETNTARGVQVRWCNLTNCTERKTVFGATKEVILSAGTARDPQILMLSGIGPKEELSRLNIPLRVELSGVGANLHDHVLSYGPMLTFPKASRGRDAQSESPAEAAFSVEGKGWKDWELGELYNFFTNRSGLFMTPAGLLTLGFVHSPISEDKSRPDLELVAMDVSPGATLSASSWLKFGLTLEDSHTLFGSEPDAQDGILISAILMRSKSRGKVHLGSKNIADYPILDLQYLSHPHDVEVLVEGLRFIHQIAEAMAPLGGTALHVRVPGCEAADQPLSHNYYECLVRSLTMSVWHMAGTCRMGAADDPEAVVDSQLRVRKTHNLRVVDASVIPEETTGHMVATVYGIAERAASLILSRHVARASDEL